MKRQQVKTAYHVQAIDAFGNIRQSRIYLREWNAVRYSQYLLEFADDLIPYIQTYALSKSNQLMKFEEDFKKQGIYLSRREAEIALWGFSNIEESE